MNIKITRSRLQEALKKVGGVADGRSVAILANVKLVASGGSLKFTTTNLDMTLFAQADCGIEEPGETTVSMRRLEQIASVLPDEGVEMSTDAAEKMTIVSGPLRMTLTGLPAKDFPKLPELKDAKKIPVSGKALLSLLRKSAYAASVDDTRKTLQGVLIELDGSVIRTVATDGRRLARAEATLEGPKPDTPAPIVQFIVPSNAIAAIQKFIAPESEVTVEMAGSQIHLSQKDGAETLYAKLLDGQYPNYRQVIPEPRDATVEVSRADLLSVLVRLGVIGSTVNPNVVMNFKKGFVSSEATGDDEAKAREDLPVKYDGPAFERVFNYRYLMDILKAFDSDVVKLNTSSGVSAPMLVTADGEDLLSVVMPLRFA